MFDMYRYKTAYCPLRSLKHDWASCIFAHRPQDFRRAPDQYSYNPDECKNSTSEENECPLGFKCKFSHSTYERLYHPLKYKTNPCDVRHHFAHYNYSKALKARENYAKGDKFALFTMINLKRDSLKTVLSVNLTFKLLASKVQ